MLFNSLDFMIFFPVVVLVYFTLPKRARQYWLLIASYYFYMSWNPRYVFLILFSTLITYVSGILMEQINQRNFDIKEEKRRKIFVVAGSFGLNIGLLLYFKYINFAFSIMGKVFSYVHINLKMPQFDIILPVGLSFFIFQALSYTMDVYRNEMHAERNFFRYALFVSFFPQLVAGPIERSKNLLEQLKEPKAFDFDRAREGLLLMLWGLFLKIVIADRIAMFVDTIYGDIATYSGYYLVVATIFFAFQIYCDFSGYSVIAMGTAKILGINLMENFDAPYFSASVAVFWRKWHISLTSWFMDYLYIPLGGNRKGKIRKYINIMLVFLTSGLWHGAAMSFVVWGGINGLYQIAGEVLMPIRDKAVSIFHLDRDSLGHKLIHVLGTFILIDFSWIFFRAGSMADAINIIKSILTVKNPWILFDGSLYNCGLDIKNYRVMLNGIAVLLFADFCKYQKISIREVIAKQDMWCRWIVIIVAVLTLVIFGIWGTSYEASNFIYFQF